MAQPQATEAELGCNDDGQISWPGKLKTRWLLAAAILLGITTL
jgi:hypothetical protein